MLLAYAEETPAYQRFFEITRRVTASARSKQIGVVRRACAYRPLLLQRVLIGRCCQVRS